MSGPPNRKPPAGNGGLTKGIGRGKTSDGEYDTLGRPHPPVPFDADVTGMPGFILEVDRLLASDLNAIGRPEEKWAALMLYCRAFRQTPPGSLPNDDRMLANLSGDPRVWNKIKKIVLRGWYVCSDGRLYHDTVAHYVLIAVEARKKQPQNPTTEAAKNRQKRWREDCSNMARQLRAMGVEVPGGASKAFLKRMLAEAENAGVASPFTPAETSTEMHEASTETPLHASPETSHEQGDVYKETSRGTGIKYKSPPLGVTGQESIGDLSASSDSRDLGCDGDLALAGADFLDDARWERC